MWRKIIEFVGNFLRQIKWFFQRIFRGYSDYDLIDYDQFVCKKILKSLKGWVKHERYGFPDEVGSMEEWNKILDDIVFAVEETATGKHEDELYKKWTKDGVDEAERYFGIGYVSDAERYKQINEIWDRTEKGMELFGKYLGAMWD